MKSWVGTTDTFQYREICTKCLQSASSCYCSAIRPFHCDIEFVILIHPLERKRRIATGRMAHLCIKNSELIEGEEFTHNRRVNKRIESSQCFVLYPGPTAVNMRETSLSELQSAPTLSDGVTSRSISIFVVDGTWATAKKTMRLSQNLKELRRIAFVPSRPSRFRVRKQPHAFCFSTIEAIHETIELLAPSPDRRHDNLLEVFDSMVERQLRFIGRHTRHNQDLCLG